MKLSDLREGDVGQMCRGGRGKFIVTWRTAEDRCSGSTRITWENGGTQDYIWDQDDPVVERVGKGRLITRIVMDGEG